jgi:predicted negative regulator of RcsB-dependent stress response
VKFPAPVLLLFLIKHWHCRWNLFMRKEPAVSACLSAAARKNSAFIYMQTQDASTEFLIKFWPWFEANRNRLIGIAMVVGVILIGWYFVTTQSEQKAMAAGQAFTQLQLNLPPNSTAQQVSEAFLNIASQYSGTVAAQRAQLQAAAVMFSAGRYADAQALFQNFLSANNGSPLTPAAQLGVAASLESQNKTDDAITAYRVVTTSYPDAAEALPAKFSLGRLLESQGKLSEASSYYQEVEHSPLAGSLASESAQHLSQIQTKLAAAQPAAKF